MTYEGAEPGVQVNNFYLHGVMGISNFSLNTLTSISLGQYSVNSYLIVTARPQFDISHTDLTLG